MLSIWHDNAFSCRAGKVEQQYKGTTVSILALLALHKNRYSSTATNNSQISSADLQFLQNAQRSRRKNIPSRLPPRGPNQSMKDTGINHAS